MTRLIKPSAEVVWVQEEPRNMGAWRFVAEQFEPIRKIRYIGRAENPSPATGSKKRHDKEQAEYRQSGFGNFLIGRAR